ncbi:hypothetical protein ACFSZS_21815 [Seohaeicola zhoushanensis]
MRIDELEARVLALPERDMRHLVAISGPPAAGKSTLAAELVARLGPGAILVPMDGFHLDNAVLAPRGLLDRKGAPETFDALGFVHAMQRLATETEVVLPDFDRAQDRAIAGRIVVGPAHRIAVVEGNYLSCTHAPWNRLARLWSLSVFLDRRMPSCARGCWRAGRPRGLTPKRRRGGPTRTTWRTSPSCGQAGIPRPSCSDCRAQA